MTIGKAVYEPGWKWSEDVSPLSGTKFCEVEHLGMVLSGSATVDFKDGKSAYDKIINGASLIQLYTGMVYQGPNIVNKITNELIDIHPDNYRLCVFKDVSDRKSVV